MGKADRELRRQERKDRVKVPFKDRPIADILKKVAPKALEIFGEVVPGVSAITAMAKMVIGDNTIPAHDKVEIQKELDREMKEYELYLNDIANSRDMYKSTDHKMADEIAHRVMKYNLWVVILAVVIEIVSVIFIDDKIIIAVISAAIGSITTALLQERQQVINFFFGSSRGSKSKDKNR